MFSFAQGKNHQVLLWAQKPWHRKGGELIGLPASPGWGRRKQRRSGRGVRTSLTQKWVFVESQKEPFVGSCSHRGHGCEERGEGRVQWPRENGTPGWVT